MKAKKKSIFYLLLPLVLFISFSCKTVPVVETEDVLEEDTKPVQEIDILENNNVEPPVDEHSDSFVVTDEVYQNTFAEIEKLIENLNEIISDKKFKQWKTFLSDSYIEKNSNPDTLELLSQSPILLNNDIVLKNLEDYFLNIVVPSRNNVKVEEIEFEDEMKIIVWSIFNGRRVKLYQLEKIDDNWKISTW